MESAIIQEYQKQRQVSMQTLAAMFQSLEKYKQGDKVNPHIVARQEQWIEHLSKFIDASDQLIKEMEQLAQTRYMNGYNDGKRVIPPPDPRRSGRIPNEEIRQVWNEHMKNKWADHY